MSTKPGPSRLQRTFRGGYPLEIDHRPLRVGVDGTKLMYRHHVSMAVFQGLAGYAGKNVPFPIPGVSPRVNPTADTKIVFECKELRVVVWKPGSAPPGVKRNYGVEVEIRGKALSSSETGMDVIETLRMAVEGMLFPEMGDTPEQRRKALAPYTFPGRTDVAVDLEQVGRGAERYARREVFFSDDEDERTNHWVCRGSAPSHIRDLSGDGMEYEEVKGNEASGRTHHRKGKRHRVVIYEKAKVRDRSRKASEVLKRIWKKSGWSGSSNVLRVELRMHAEWISREMPGVNYDEFLRILWKLARRLAKRDRHLAYDPLSEQRKSRRPMSPLWEAVRRALKRLRPA